MFRFWFYDHQSLYGLLLFFIFFIFVPSLLALESLLDRCVCLYEKNENYLVETSSLKYLSGKLAQRITSECIDLVGGIGFTEDLPLAKLYRDSKIGSIYEGTNNIQLETISKQNYICF